jgi:hypothetical protein
LIASVADVAALVASEAALFAVSVAELTFSLADLSLEQPTSPLTTIAAPPMATVKARFTPASPFVVPDDVDGPNREVWVAGGRPDAE